MVGLARAQPVAPAISGSVVYRDGLAPPTELLEFLPLAVLVNGILTALNELRYAGWELSADQPSADLSLSVARS